MKFINIWILLVLVLGLISKMSTSASVHLSKNSSIYVVKEETKPVDPIRILLYARTIMKVSTAVAKSLIIYGWLNLFHSAKLYFFLKCHVMNEKFEIKFLLKNKKHVFEVLGIKTVISWALYSKIDIKVRRLGTKNFSR